MGRVKTIKREITPVTTAAIAQEDGVNIGSSTESTPIKKKNISSAERAGLVFPPSRFRRYMKKALLAKRIGAGAGVYCAAVIEYLIAEVMELSGCAAHDNKFKRIKPRHIMLAIRNDEELDQVFKGITISQGGVIPHIHAVLLPKRTVPRVKTNIEKVEKSKPKQSKEKAAATVAAVDETMDNNNK